MKRHLLWAALLAVFGAGCRAGGCVAATFGDIIGTTGDAYCDRRFVDDPATESRAPFCQEIIDTVARGRFEDDCEDKHGAATGDGLCPRADIIAGCRLDKVNDDGSEVYDWYYDVSAIIADAGDQAGPDGAPTFVEPPLTKDDVADLCADPSRYEEGAELRDPP